MKIATFHPKGFWLLPSILRQPPLFFFSSNFCEARRRWGEDSLMTNKQEQGLSWLVVNTSLLARLFGHEEISPEFEQII